MQLTTPTPLNVFVTGASTGLAHDLIKRLIAAGHKVTGAVETSDQAIALRALGAMPAYPSLLREGEIRSALKAMGSNAVIHLATQVPNHVPHINPNWDQYLDLVTQGTDALMGAAKSAGVQYLVYLSYAFVYGDTHGHAADETTKPAPNLPAIATAALRAEQVVLQGDVPAAVLRAGYIYGGHNQHTIALRDELKSSRRPTAMGEAHAANWVHSDDLIEAILLALHQQPQNEIINVVDDTPVSPAKFAEYLAEAMNVSITTMPRFLSNLMTNKDQSALLDLTSQASNAKAKSLLGWKPVYPSYRAGIDQALLILRAEEPIR
jgi:nucleoside-diphosphate-sugar epimerase